MKKLIKRYIMTTEELVIKNYNNNRNMNWFTPELQLLLNEIVNNGLNINNNIYKEILKYKIINY
jgi:hypothetical protein